MCTWLLLTHPEFLMQIHQRGAQYLVKWLALKTVIESVHQLMFQYPLVPTSVLVLCLNDMDYTIYQFWYNRCIYGYVPMWYSVQLNALIAPKLYN